MGTLKRLIDITRDLSLRESLYAELDRVIERMRGVVPPQLNEDTDTRLSRFLELDTAVKQMTKELDGLKSELKRRGSHSTDNYICLVTEQNRTVAPSLDVLREEIGEERLTALCRTTTYETVKVSEKKVGTQ